MTDRLAGISDQDTARARLRGVADGSSAGGEGGLDSFGVVALIVAGGVVVGIIVLLICLSSKRCILKPKHGREMVSFGDDSGKKQAMTRQVSWRIQEGASADPEGGKTHIVWNIRQVQDMKEMLDKEEEEEAAARPRDSDGEEQSPRTKLQAAGSPKRRRPEELVSAYEDGATVEYFSVTNSQWLPGSMHLSILEDPDGSLRVGYNVRLPRDKLRHDVPLKQLRLPMHDSEPVELRRWLRGGNSVWHPATVYGPQSASCTTVGYKVELPRPEEEDLTLIEQGKEVVSKGLGTVRAVASSVRSKLKSRLNRSSSLKAGEESGAEEADPYILTKVPPSRMRRRFDPGETVQVFREADRGWVAASVVEKVAEKLEASASRSWSKATTPSEAQASEPERMEQDDSAASPSTAKKGRPVEAWEEAMQDLRGAEEALAEEEQALEARRKAAAEVQHDRATQGLDHRRQAELERFERSVVAAKAEVDKKRKKAAAAEARLERNLVNPDDIWSVLRVREDGATADCEVPLFLIRGPRRDAPAEAAEVDAQAETAEVGAPAERAAVAAPAESAVVDHPVETAEI